MLPGFVLPDIIVWSMLHKVIELVKAYHMKNDHFEIILQPEKTLKVTV